MRKAVALVIGMILTGIFASSTFAYTTTLDFFGGVLYGEGAGGDGEFDGYFMQDSTPVLETEDWAETDPNILSELNGHGPFYGIAAVAYDVDWDLPEWDTAYDWYLGVDVWAEGETDSDEFDEAFATDDDVFLGNSSLGGLLGASKAEVLSFLSGIPLSDGADGVGGYLIDGDLNSGEIYLALYDSIPNILENEEILLPWDIEWPETLSGEFGGTITLSAEGAEPVVPEPASIALLGFGLIGLLGRKKK